MLCSFRSFSALHDWSLESVVNVMVGRYITVYGTPFLCSLIKKQILNRRYEFYFVNSALLTKSEFLNFILNPIILSSDSINLLD